MAPKMGKKEACRILASYMNAAGIIDCFDVEDIVKRNTKKIPTELFDALYTLDLTLAGNGAVYKKDKPSFLSQVMKKLLDERKEVKRRMLDLKQEMESIKDKLAQMGKEELIAHHKQLEEEISRLDTLQYAIKVRLNSAYGAL
jgi:DNA polymerase elongation subunit (family B)